MNHDALTRFLGEKVLGWAVSEDGWRWLEDRWNPLVKLGHCAPLLDKIEQDGWIVVMRYNPMLKGWSVTIDKFQDEVSMVYAHSEKLTDALCLTIAEAYGWEDGA